MDQLENIDFFSKEVNQVGRTMKKFGGNFVSHLGEALLCADYENAHKIKEAFSEYWKQYLEMSENL